MRSVALCSVRGAPGVTTTALLLASRLGGSVLVEADLSGGVIAARYGLGREPGLTTLAASRLPEPAAWLDHAQDAGGVPVLVGPDSPEASESLWRTTGDRLAAAIDQLDGRVVIDAGRLQRATPIALGAELLLVLARPLAEQLVGVSHALSSLQRASRGHVAVVLIGRGPYRAADVQTALGCHVLAHLPDDPTSAERLIDGRGSQARIARSPLGRAVAVIGDEIEPLWPALDAVVTP